MKTKAFIFAGDHHQYELFIRENHLDRRQYPPLTDTNWRGIADADLIRIGTYYLREELLIMLPYIEQYFHERRSDAKV